MIRHHPDDAMLAALAAATLPRGQEVVTAAHVERCARCGARLRELEAVGGALLEDAEPALLAPEALARTLARIDAPRAPSTTAHPDDLAARDPRAQLQASLPDGMTWPRSLHGAATTRWRWLGPGMRWSRVTLADDRAANVFLLRIAAGKSLPVHSHRGIELTQVLYGAFHDGRERFAAGDFDETDDTVRHQPVVEAGGECICLASVEGRVAFDGRIARVLGALVGM